MYRGLTLRNQQPLHLDENAALGLLQHLDKTELQNLLDDDSKLTGVIDDLQQIKNFKADKETMIASNKSLADYNLSVEPRLVQAKSQLAEKYEQAVEVQKEFEKNKQQLDYIGEQQSLSTTLAILQTETAKSEEASEEIAEKWLDDTIEVEDFIEQFAAKRTEAHERRVKSEKMKELLRNQGEGTNRMVAPSVAMPYPVNYGYPQY